MNYLNKPKFETDDFTAENRKKLAELFPGAVAEGKVNIDLLRTYIGEDFFKDEAYEFTWVGKREAIAEAGKPIRKTLRPCVEESKNWNTTENLYIEGDNLDVLKLLQESYLGKVKMIYIDPPYNTGNDFIYNDKFVKTSKQEDEEAGVYNDDGERMFKNTETNGRFHSDWCSMIYPRLVLARNMLRDDGVIFISIDDNEVAQLRKICDEVFGESNFIAQLIWERAYSPKNDAKYVSNSHDYVLMVGKNLSSFQIGRLPRTEEANARYSNPDNDPRGVWKPSDLSVKTYNAAADYNITTPSGRIIEPPTGRCWRLSKNTFLERLQDNRIWFGVDGNSVPQIKRFLSELKYEGMAAQSIMFYKDVGHSQEGAQEVTKLIGSGAFDGPKPVRLLRRLLALANLNNDDIILDFFSGSATTAHAVMQLNAEDGGKRKFIMVQLPEVCKEGTEAAKAGYKNICEIGKERIRRAGNKILELSLENLEKEGVIVKNERKLSEADSLAKSDGDSNRNLPFVWENTEDRNLQSARPNEEGGNIDSKQYSGRTGARNEGVYSLSENSEGIESGTGNTVVDKCTLRLLAEYGYRINDEYVGGNFKNDGSLDKKAKLSILSSKLSTDIGFRVLKLDSTNMNDVYYSPGEITQDMLPMMESNIKEDRSDMDLLFACLLDWGLPLSMPEKQEKINGFTVYTYNNGDLIACFDKNISEKTIREIADRKPLRAVFRDASFSSSPEKINVFEIFKLLAPNTSVKVI